MAVIKNPQGSLHPPMLLALMAISIGGLGTWGFLRHWRFLVETQLRLDQCVGKTAWELRDHLNSLRSGNQRIRRLRIAIQAARPRPELASALQAALNAVVIHQEAAVLKWKIKQVSWGVSRGCGKWGDSAPPLPAPPLRREPPDAVGPQPLTWYGDGNFEFHLQANHRPRSAAALVQGKTNASEKAEFNSKNFDDTLWSTLWTAPGIQRRASHR